MASFHVLAPDDPDRLISLPYAGQAPPPMGRKLANTTILVRDPAQPDRIWKLTPWEKAESVARELAIYARLMESAAPGTVGLLGVSGTSEHLARAYEYAPFGELSQFLRNGRRQPQPLDSHMARHLLGQVAVAMAGLHARGIVHRDLKAENILVFDGGPLPVVRLGDFDRSIELAPGQTLGAPVGSLFHMAPELHAAQPYDHRVDLFAFGMLIHEVAHGGARLFANVASGLPGAMTAERFADDVSNANLRPHWHHPDARLGELAARCLSHDPAQRPGFDQIIATLTVKPHPPARLAPPPPLPATIGMAATIGLRRQKMEDAAAVLHRPDACIMAVFDGFRGARVSDFSARALAFMLVDAMKELPDDAAAMRLGLSRLQARLRRLDPLVTPGSTATVAIVRDSRICLGWLGDSPAYLIGDDGPRALTRPHHPDDPAEADRIIASGGTLRRETRMMDNGEEVPWGPMRVHAQDGSGGIALTRALGVPALSTVISALPQTADIPIGPDDRFLVLATDGAFEGLRPEVLADIVTRAGDPQKAAQQIIAAVLDRVAPDNASVLVMDLRRPMSPMPT